MGLSIPVIAQDNVDFINRELEKYERELHPSAGEDEELVRRAVFSVRNKSVLFERYNTASSKLFTVVQDVRPAEVTIDFRHQATQCTCPQKMCRHQLGVLLGLYQYFGSVQEWAANWRNKKSVQFVQLATERTPESWQRMVEEVMNHLLPAGRRIESYLVTSIIDHAHAKLRRYMPLEREWQPIYKLYMELAVLNKIWSHFIATASPLHSDYFQYAMDRRYEYALDIIDELSSKSRLFATDPFYDALQQQVRTLLLQGEGLPHLRISFYLVCWEKIFHDKKRAEQELAALADMKQAADIPRDAISLLFYIVLKDYKAIEQSLQHIQPEFIHIYEALVHFARNVFDERAATLLLKAMLPHVKQYIQEVLPPHHRQLFTNTLNDLYAAIELTEAEELILYGAFGRYGIQPYSDYLLQKGRYADWVALHQLYPSSISYLESIGLKQVLSENPAATLPLYHHYAMEEIKQKSRMNYKQAVRLWKGMKSAAKKAGKTAYFEAYMENVRLHFKRLRALQEELDKAKLC
ncbi:hypothetical protein AAGS61_03840 [Lysinibacillus sp. KU-BSD001]|uniref:hypothetical protein n=1 Tax=Lysinibacillus sp. KU-BSD001 TaxID=3141328 RepID=UPI0036EBBB17